jgi:hypothetical protein
MLYLDERLNQTEGMCPQWLDPRVTRRPGYVYITQFDPSTFGGISSRHFATALAAEGFPCGTGNPPMHRYDLLQLTDKNSFVYRNFKDRLDFSNMHFPVAEKASQTNLWVAHQMFLGGTDLMDAFVEGIEKVLSNSRALKEYNLSQSTAKQAAHLKT